MSSQTSAHGRALAPQTVDVASRALTDVTSSPSAEVDEVRTLDPSRERGTYERFVKPVLDRLAGATLLIAFAPVLLLLAIAVAASLGSPIFIRQRRIGLSGRAFAMYKFRTMLPDRRCSERRQTVRHGGPDRRKAHKTADDPRHTPMGRFLRRWSLDELPQLLNVVRGDMSLVGPRPELPHIVERYEPWQHTRHSVRPGLTGPWQVTARGDGTLMHEHTEMDVAYAQHVSPRTDLKILLHTVPALMGLRPGD